MMTFPSERVCRGAGLGLRIPHIPSVLQHRPAIDWFEVHICNFLNGGLNRTLLQEVARDYPLSFHGVSLNLGGCEALDTGYLHALQQAVDEFQPALVSEHACLTAHQGEHFHDLIPVPFNARSARHMAKRIVQVQDALGRRILIENLSRYARYEESSWTEAEFLTEVCELSGCDLLLDLNNAYVNQINLGESWQRFVEGLPLERIREVHLAGHSLQGEYLIDTHNRPVCDEVWDAYQALAPILNGCPVLIEWDSDLPDFSVLQQHCNKAARIHDSIQARSAGVSHEHIAY